MCTFVLGTLSKTAPLEKLKTQLIRFHPLEAGEWVGWLRHAIDDLRVQPIGILVDDYSASIEDAYDEETPLPAVRELKLAEVTIESLKRLSKGTLYRVRK